MDIMNDKVLAEELADNYVKLKKCRRIYNIIFCIFLGVGIILMGYSITSLSGSSWDWLFVELEIDPLSPIAFALIADSVITAPLAFYLAYRGTLKQHDLCAMLAFALETANLVFMCILKARKFFEVIPIAFYVFAVGSVICIAAAAVNMRTNMTYHWLEQQQGFPQFNLRFEQQKEDKYQRGIMDKFEQQKRQWQKNSSGDMADISPVKEEEE
ncbi:MAG: hypothetical protein IJ874_04165 [Ruminococcus sp.]|nr:hypothetical protein [Ruminococcus sp.]